MVIYFIAAVIGLLCFGTGWLVGRRTKHWAAPAFAVNALSRARLQSAHNTLAKRTQRRLDKIMVAATQVGEITNDGVEELFCISDRTASTYLRTLTESGRLQKHGTGRGTYYVPSKPLKESK